MPIETLQPIREAAGELPADWLDHVSLPPNTPAGLIHRRDWWATPLADRHALVGEAQKAEEVPALFVLWEWEMDPAVRTEIVRALGQSDDIKNTNAVLRMIFLEETPDQGGQAVRREAKQILSKRADQEALAEHAHGVVRTRGAIRTRGAVRTRGATPGPTSDRSARAILAEIEDLQAANPRLSS